MIKERANTSVLLVDDEANILSSLRRLLRGQGYQILTAHSGMEALEILQDEVVQVVVSDMRMPEMNGAELVSQIAQKWPDIIRIILTGHADMDITVKAINEGNIYRYLTKPWDDNDLIQTIASGLEQYHLKLERDRLFKTVQEQNKVLKSMNIHLKDEVKDRQAEIQQTADMLDKAYEELNESYLASVPVFVNLIEARLGVKQGESRHAAELAKKVALACEQDEKFIEELYLATMLRNIGKIGLRDRLLNTPYSLLNKDDKQIIRNHPVDGEAALMDLPSLSMVTQYIRHHHELFSGNGVPDGLAGEDIPLASRIMLIVADYIDLQSTVLMPQKMDVEGALEHLKQYAGKFYDPELVEVFVNCLSEHHKEEIEQSEKLVESYSLREGMVLARDVYSDRGILLLTKGKVVNNDYIGKIMAYEKAKKKRLELYIVIDR